MRTILFCALFFATPALAQSPGARLELALFQAMPTDVLTSIVVSGHPDAHGMVGHNRGGLWFGAEYQKSVNSLVIAAAAWGNSSLAEAGWAGVTTTFMRQASDGSFGRVNDDRTPAATQDSVSDAAWWLAYYCQAALILRESSLGPQFSERISGFMPNVRRAATLLSANQQLLVNRDSGSTHRYFLDGLAYSLAGMMLSDWTLTTQGSQFIQLAQAKQDMQGYYQEKGGWDSSYNASSILFFQTYDLYFPQPWQKASISDSVWWEMSRINPDGSVNTDGNTKTNSRDVDFGTANGVNYGEVESALLLYGLRQRVVLDSAASAYKFKNAFVPIGP